MVLVVHVSSRRRKCWLFGDRSFQKEGGSLRGSIMIVGLLLARFGKGTYQNQVEIKLDVEG
jgi:hypothetical protein